MRKVVLSWSSGKDSAWALHRLRNTPDIEVVALATTFNGAVDRVAMHAVRRALVRAQADRTSLPLWEVDLPWPCSNEDYAQRMLGLCGRALADQVTAFAFGDLFLRDVRDYRERQLKGTGLEPLFPLWGLPTRGLAGEMISAGTKAKITCVDPSKLDKSFAGRGIGSAFLADLPPGVDPCGENGEFHTFVHDSPVFSRPVEIEDGAIVERDGFVFADVLPAGARAT